MMRSRSKPNLVFKFPVKDSKDHEEFLTPRSMGSPKFKTETSDHTPISRKSGTPSK